MNEPKNVVLGLDPATVTGWVVMETDGVQHEVTSHGTFDMTPGRHDSQGMAYLRLNNWLHEILNLVKPTLVAFEEVPAHKGVHAAHRYGGVVSHIMRVCDVQEVPYTGVPIATWKKMATGKGNASKKVVAAAFTGTCEETEHERWSQDEIDAYYITLAAVRGL